MGLKTIRKIQQLRKLREEATKLREARRTKRPPSTEPARFTTEALLTGPFGLATATSVQRAACRVLDGLPLGDLASDRQVIEFLTDGETIPLDLRRGHQWRDLVFLAAERGAKTLIASAAALRMTQTVDVRGLTVGEVPRVPIVSVLKDNTSAAFSFLKGALERPELKHLLLDDPTADTILVRGPHGRPIEVKCVAGSKAGATLVSKWLAGVIFDEATRMAGKEAAVNLADSRTAIAARMLPGAQALYIGSPWKPHGEVYDLKEKYWSNPDDDIVVLRATGPMLNPGLYTDELLDKLQRTNPRSYQVNGRAEFVDAELGLFDVDLLASLTRATPVELPPSPLGNYFAGVDPSGGSVNANGFALVIVQRRYDDSGRPFYPVAYCNEWRGMRPREIWEQVALQCKRYGLHIAHTDQFAAEANADLAMLYGLELIVTANTNQANVDGFTNLQTLAKEGQIELPPHMGKDSPGGMMRRDLLNVSSKVTQTGIRIELAKTSDGRHSDYAPALVKALEGAREETNPLIEAMRERIRRRQANGQQ